MNLNIPLFHEMGREVFCKSGGAGPIRPRTGKDIGSLVMKKVLRWTALSFTILIAFWLLPKVLSRAPSAAHFYIGLYRDNVNNTCEEYYDGAVKGIYWAYGEWHHYVDFEVEDWTDLRQWKIMNAPMPASFSRGQSDPSALRIVYRWPYDWPDPFPADVWQICFAPS
jgi:hypothetical protein